MDIIAIIISIVAFLFTLFTYIIHDVKLKKQDALINKYKLEKINLEKEESKKAIVEANIIKEPKGKRIVKVYNKGRSVARNVKINIVNDNEITYNSIPCPKEIRPQHAVEFVVYLALGSADTLVLEFEWEDNFSEKNKDSQTLFL